MGTQWTRGLKNTKIQLGFYLLVLIFCWAFRYRRLERTHGQTTDMVGMKLFGADHPYIHYVGRWMTTADGQRKEACFSDSYFDFRFNQSTRVLVSIHNNGTTMSTLPDEYPAEILAIQGNQIEYVDEGSLRVKPYDIVLQPENNFRVLAPLLNPSHNNCIQVDGIWLDKDAVLLPAFDSEAQLTQEQEEELAVDSTPSGNRKWLEVVSDTPGLPGYPGYGNSTQQTIHKVFTKWEYFIGEMFGVDHTTIGLDGMCLIHSCIGGTGSPMGIGELYFKNAAFALSHVGETWRFPSRAPDVMVLNLGTSDDNSFEVHFDKYDANRSHLNSWFEDSYVTFIQSIRNLAYSAGEIEVDRVYGYSSQSRSSNMPIFVMRPFGGHLEAETHSVVNRLRQQGDNSVFWVDTSGWLNTDVKFDKRPEDQDIFLDELGPSKQFRLTERGHQRAAILLHSHVCRFLARDVEECPFLPPEIYDGNQHDGVEEGPQFDEREAELDWKWSKT